MKKNDEVIVGEIIESGDLKKSSNRDKRFRWIIFGVLVFLVLLFFGFILDLFLATTILIKNVPNFPWHPVLIVLTILWLGTRLFKKTLRPIVPKNFWLVRKLSIILLIIYVIANFGFWNGLIYISIVVFSTLLINLFLRLLNIKI